MKNCSLDFYNSQNNKLPFFSLKDFSSTISFKERRQSIQNAIRNVDTFLMKTRKKWIQFENTQTALNRAKNIQLNTHSESIKLSNTPKENIKQKEQVTQNDPIGYEGLIYSQKRLKNKINSCIGSFEKTFQISLTLDKGKPLQEIEEKEKVPKIEIKNQYYISYTEQPSEVSPPGFKKRKMFSAKRKKVR